MVAFVTGTSSGFGAAIARRFAKDGMRVVATARRIEKLTPLKKEFGDLILPAALDVRDRPQVESLVAGLPADFAAIDVLVNNAGLSLNLEPAYRVPIEDWETMVDTNIKGLLYCTRLLLPGMVARGRGHVVNIGSVAAMYAYPGGNVYGATKAFVKQFSHNLRADLLGTAVRVTDIEPGLAETEFSVVRFKGDEKRAASIYTGTQPLTAEDIADAVHWVVTRPAHVNIDTISMMPVCQAFSPLAIYRGKTE
ncbi:MAG TPA: SDR family oxidoreductase [Chthoniobacterales bacterium]|jgi:3-hydroxy acid dehydrogenase/malonic semialdehyde reductase